MLVLTANTEYNSTGPRTTFGISRPFQDFTWTHCPRDFKTGWLFTDGDGVCASFPELALLEDKKHGAKCSTGQMISLEILDALISAGVKATGGCISFTACGRTYHVTLSYAGLVFRTDAAADGADVTYSGPVAAEYVVKRGQCYGLDGIIRDRSGRFMLLMRKHHGVTYFPKRRSVLLAIHHLVLAGIKATNGRVHPPSARYPIRLKYHGLNLFEHEQRQDIASGRMWWNGEEHNLPEIIRAFTFQNPEVN